MASFLKRIVIVFLFGLSIGLNLNNNSNPEFNSDKNSITLVNSLHGGKKSDSNLNPAFVQTPPGQRSSVEQLTNIQDLTPKFGYRTSLSGGKKLPDNSGSGDSWDENNQYNENEFGWKKDPEVWSKYQGYCQD